MSRDDYTPRGLSDPESHLELAGQRQRPHFDVGTGSEPVAPSPNQQGQNVTLNAALEVDMLRHKLRTLENLVERYGTSSPASLLERLQHHSCFVAILVTVLRSNLILLYCRHFVAYPLPFSS